MLHSFRIFHIHIFLLLLQWILTAAPVLSQSVGITVTGPSTPVFGNPGQSINTDNGSQIAIILVSVGSVVGLLLFILTICLCCRCCNRRKKQQIIISSTTTATTSSSSSKDLHSSPRGGNSHNDDMGQYPLPQPAYIPHRPVAMATAHTAVDMNMDRTETHLGVSQNDSNAQQHYWQQLLEQQQQLLLQQQQQLLSLQHQQQQQQQQHFTAADGYPYRHEQDQYKTEYVAVGAKPLSYTGAPSETPEPSETSTLADFNSLNNDSLEEKRR